MFYVNFDINFLVIKNLNNYIRKFRIKIIGRKRIWIHIKHILLIKFIIVRYHSSEW